MTFDPKRHGFLKLGFAFPKTSALWRRFLVTPKHPPRLSVIVSFMVSRICHFARVFFLSCLNSVAPG